MKPPFVKRGHFRANWNGALDVDRKVRKEGTKPTIKAAVSTKFFDVKVQEKNARGTHKKQKQNITSPAEPTMEIRPQY